MKGGRVRDEIDALIKRERDYIARYPLGTYKREYHDARLSALTEAAHLLDKVEDELSTFTHRGKVYRRGPIVHDPVFGEYRRIILVKG